VTCRVVGVVALALMLLFCSCATSLLRSTGEYRRVTPSRHHLIWSWVRSTPTCAPVLRTTLANQYLSRRVETNRYRTDYTWVNRGCWLGASALFALAEMWFYNHTRMDTSDGKWFTFGYLNLLLGVPCLALLARGVIQGGGGVNLRGTPLSPRYWSKEVVIPSDTSYRDAEPRAGKSALVSSADPLRTENLRVDESGELSVDIRNFYEGLPADSALRLTATLSGESAMLVVPAEYVRSVRQHEADASGLFAHASSAASEGQDETALVLYDSVRSTYASTRAAVQASDEIGRLRARIGQVRLAQAEGDFQRVSMEKVQYAIGRLDLTGDESNVFARAVENLSRDDAAEVMRAGFALLLPNSGSAAAYRQLSLFQKFYALLRYKESVGDEARMRLEAMLDIDAPTIDRLITMDSRTMLK